MNTQNKSMHSAQISISHAVFIQDQQIKTDSLKVAEAFGKRHTNILRAIENLDSTKSFNELNFELVEYMDAKGESRPMYEMTKDGWMFLVMGFTGEKAAQIKIAFINAFNAMAVLLQNQQLIEQQGISVGSKVQLKSGSPELTVNRFIPNAEGHNDRVEVIWFGNRLYKETLSIHAVIPVHEQQNQMLKQFWEAIYQYGLDKLNHGYKAELIALNLTQLYEVIHGLPERKILIQQLKVSSKPYPQYMDTNLPIRSVLTGKTVKCVVFKSPALLGEN
ncbi:MULTISPECIES: Rha family transcriptional regulator [Acinetobacter calcoaceticus/baumannii complex]|uniref:Rha family transcriptional regulator n=2 Tax=Gammaproteobacteria TaxID=1236 RepID=UPI000450F2D3|nr:MULTISPECIES: Rha family transcriptional regulator [Acinetobacter calcoaceticus/baumannii complex]EXE79516.1 phage regulatory, Rha family protein [Acinetobacter sp. 1566109]MBF6953885.1 Rha family transcriptional regulator [Acinetobacter baumannii]MBJ9959329.1 Rha family transcriptional regulator [Acinetobacter nosocomialis]MBR7686204.1 Rha family transcriptional regulator [Acinetobacter nosocomialis]MBR7701627.1 Rha family transcriptional regulator [Acinetobacter nosocomialis]